MRSRHIVEHRRAWRAFLAPVLLLTLLVSGCSAKFLYNRLDTLASWYFESLVSLNDGQRTELRAWLERTLTWHRQSELTRYADFVSDLAGKVTQPGDRAAYDAVRIRFQGLIDDLVAKTAPDASQLLLRLSPQQIDELLANLARKSEESATDSAKAVANNRWQPKQAKDLIRQMKRWTGSVSAEQKRIIVARIGELEPTYADWAESQFAWREALRGALRQRDEGTRTDEASRRIMQLLEEPNSQWTPAYSEKVDRNRERYLQLLGELDGSLSREQREHLRAELLTISRQLHHLAGR